LAIAAIPSSFAVQSGNGDILVSWALTAGATSYSVQRSTDGVSYSVIATPSDNQYLDESVTVGTLYYYKVASVNSSGTSSYTNAQSAIPTITGDLSLGQTRLMAKQRADMVNSQFVTDSEWNTYINQSYFELYDLLVNVFEDYFVADPVIITTDGSDSYALPNGTNFSGARPYYKLLGVDCGQGPTSNNAWVTLKKFEFIKRNAYIYPNVTSTYLGVFNVQYRVLGNKIKFIPVPSANQYMRIWYIPRMQWLLRDTDILEGISGWGEYVIVDAAIKAMQKEESDVSVLMLQKQMLKARIEESASNRDAGAPDTISNTRGNTGYGKAGGWGDGGFGAGW
jgi:hypothetical protein